MSRCIGCGVKIQTTDPNDIGYIPEIALIEKGDQVYCKRCYDIRHHNIKYFANYNPDAYYEKIKIIQHQRALVLLMIDVLDIYGGFIPQLSSYIGENPVLIVVNKVDILPKGFQIQKLENRIREIASAHSIRVVAIMMISAKKAKDVQKVIEKISKLKYPSQPKKDHRYIRNKEKTTRYDDCYIVGCASVGKSTFMNMVGKLTLHYPDEVITTNSQYQTTLDFIKWPLDQNSYLIDTPGLINENHFGAYLNNESIQLLIPKTYIKPRTYQLRTEQSILIGGLVQLDFECKEGVNVSFYISNELYLHRTKTKEVERVKASLAYQKLVPPYTLEESDNIQQLTTYHFKVEQPMDLFICGIGFVHIVSQYAHIKVIIDKKILVQCVESFM
ncbi:MAG: 50S ribosome-binding GTPase [Prevotella sp.]|nr:50S ribosome-binding GTPase [Staphylococcus sp.]MCM1349971.1 50S ribosome-binding GTPase [Prevotella sp.]